MIGRLHARAAEAEARAAAAEALCAQRAQACDELRAAVARLAAERDALRARLEAVTSQARVMVAGLTKVLEHQERCPRRGCAYGHHHACPRRRCAGVACWRGVPCECLLDSVQGLAAAMLAALEGGPDGG
jgi:hypothetical protein